MQAPPEARGGRAIAFLEMVLELIDTLFFFGKLPPKRGSWRSRLEIVLLVDFGVVLIHHLLTRFRS